MQGKPLFMVHGLSFPSTNNWIWKFEMQLKCYFYIHRIFLHFFPLVYNLIKPTQVVPTWCPLTHATVAYQIFLV